MEMMVMTSQVSDGWEQPLHIRPVDDMSHCTSRAVSFHQHISVISLELGYPLVYAPARSLLAYRQVLQPLLTVSMVFFCVQFQPPSYT
jgi:hypothetical protein